MCICMLSGRSKCIVNVKETFKTENRAISQSSGFLQELFKFVFAVRKCQGDWNNKNKGTIIAERMF